jgi:hypothetical protein
MSGRSRVLGLSMVCLTVLAAGCAGGSKDPSVASEPPRNATAELAEYAACMSSDGVPMTAMPGGGLAVGQGPGMPAPGSPPYRSAQKACQKLLPTGGLSKPSKAQVAQRLAQGLAFAACMRGHGVPGFPDPNAGGGFDIGPGTDGGIDPASTRFTSAQKRCQKNVPGVAGIAG